LLTFAVDAFCYNWQIGAAEKKQLFGFLSSFIFTGGVQFSYQKITNSIFIYNLFFI